MLDGCRAVSDRGSELEPQRFGAVDAYCGLAIALGRQVSGL